MNSQKRFTIGLIIFGVSLLLIGCKGEAGNSKKPLEKNYNPKTLSQDLEAISDSNTVIIKNIINAYQKAGKLTNSIAGNEVIMIESSTYNQLIKNYNQFHSNWKEAKKKELVAELDSLMNRKIKTPFLRENFKVWLLPEKVKNPENGYVSFRLLYENKSDKSIKINGELSAKILSLDKTLELSPEGFIPANDSKIEYIPAYKFSKDETPYSKKQLYLLLNNSDKFTYGNKKYSLNDISLTERGIDEAVIKKKREIIKKFKKQYKNEFPRTFWPYNTERFKQKKSELISEYYKKFTNFLKSHGHI